MNKFGKIFVACAAMAAMAAPALAKDVTLYGSARLATFYEHVDAAPGNIGNDTDLRFRNQGNARFGLRASDGPLGGHFEGQIGTGALSLRLLYGTYKFDAGTLLIGQAETPYNYLLPSVVLDDRGGFGYGVPYSSRRAQMRFTMGNGFYVAGMDPVGLTTGGIAATTTPVREASPSDENNVYMPQLVVGFANKVDGFDYNVGVTGIWYEERDTDVFAGMAYIVSNIDLGVAKVAFTAHGGQNAGAFLLDRAVAAPRFEFDTTGELLNRRNVYNAGASLAVNAFGANVGGAYAYDKPEGLNSTRDKWMAFANYPVRVAKGFTVVPEVAYYNTAPSSALHAGGRDNYFAGAKWQIDF